jgi:hypothetical protein
LFWQHHPRRKIAASQHPDPYKNDLSFAGAMVYQKERAAPARERPELREETPVTRQKEEDPLPAD